MVSGVLAAHRARHPPLCTPASKKRNIVNIIEQQGQKEAEQILGLGIQDMMGQSQWQLKLSGVNKVVVLAYVVGIQETHINIHRILELLNFRDAKYWVSGDLKIINILLGKSGHVGKFA